MTTKMVSLVPQFFDIFGAAAFVYVTIFALMLLFGKVTSKWANVFLFLIGLIGLIVDGILVYTFYLK